MITHYELNVKGLCKNYYVIEKVYPGLMERGGTDIMNAGKTLCESTGKGAYII